MRLHRFYSPIVIPEAGNFSYTHEPHIYQWGRVFRYKTGDRVILFDGRDYDYECEIIELTKKSAQLSVCAKNESSAGARTRRMTLCFGMLKGSHTDFVLEKAVELGVTHIIPLITERTEKKELSMERACKVIIEASEQSGWGSIPTVSEPILFTHIEPSVHAVCFDREGTPIQTLSQKETIDMVIIGPEGGWSETERVFIKEKGIPLASFGSNTLRAETAVIAGLSSVFFGR